MDTTNLDRQIAQQTIANFCARFSEFETGYYRLAQYASLPLILTPELVGFLRSHFLRGEIPYIAEADLLLSDLCRQVGYERFVMEPTVKAQLLGTLDPEAKREVASLLLHYIAYLVDEKRNLTTAELENQQWGAMVYLDDYRETAVVQIKERLLQLVQGTSSDIAIRQLSKLVNEVTSQLEDYSEVVDYARQVGKAADITAIKEIPFPNKIEPNINEIDSKNNEKEQLSKLNLMLPVLLKNSRIKRGTTGKWNRQSILAFSDVAHSIDVTVAGDVVNVNSMPSMWARPLSLESILLNTELRMRIRTSLINQWCGMLAAIALAPDFEDRGKLTAQVIDLTDARYRNNSFIQSLVRLVPSDEKSLFDLPKKVNPWLKGYVFRWNSKSIGMTSPSTIVCPAEDADWTGLPWFIDNEVQSPEKYLTPDQKYRLSRWLVHLRKKITEQGIGVSEPIAALINSFIDDLGGDRQRDLNTDDDGNIIDLGKEEPYFGIQLDIGIYSVINQPSRNHPREKEKVFLPELYFLRRSDAFPNADLHESFKSLSFGGSPISVILPIQSSFFNRADYAKLLSTLKVQLLRAGTALKFSMQVDGHLVEREYELKNENAIDGLPVAEIWPNFISPNWKIYYGYTLLDIDDTKLSFEFPNVTNHSENTHKFERSKLSRFASFPNHVICLYDEKIVGCIPLKMPLAISATGRRWDVGVDFGTSFTNAYKKQGGIDEKLSFEDLHYRVTASNETERLTALTDNFIPPNQILPIASLLTVKNGKNPVRYNRDREAEILFDAQIYTVGSLGKIQDDKNYLISNLKWNNVNDREYMHLFIEQFALQISAQAVKSGVTEIKWALSYPTAFSVRDKKTYAKVWNICSEKLSEITGLNYEELHLKGSRNFQPESLAVAHYFVSKKYKNLLNAACIDIGGGTSDISIWGVQNNLIVPIYQCSVQLAGKHLFSNIIKRDPEFLNHIKLANNDTLIWLQEDPNLFAIVIDALVKSGGDNWLKNQREKLQDDERLYEYLQILSIGIAGLHYYIGIVLQVLHHEDENNNFSRYKSGESIDDIYFAGNGSRLLNWLSDTGKLEDDEISNLFQEMVIKGSGFKPRGETSFISDKPKEEVACGLVVGKKMLGDPTLLEDELIAGEPCKIGFHIFDWNSYIKLELDIFESIDKLEIAEKAEDLVNLPKFLYWFHKRLEVHDISIPPLKGFSLGDPQKSDEENLKNTIADNLRLWNQVVRTLKNSLILEDGATTEVIRLEPPFILALKALIEVLTDEWADK